MYTVVIFLEQFSGFSFFFLIKACWLWLLKHCRRLVSKVFFFKFHYMAESCRNLFPSHETKQESHAECGCERTFLLILILSLLRLFRCPQQTLRFSTLLMLKRVVDPNKNNFLVTERYFNMPCRTLSKTPNRRFELHCSALFFYGHTLNK